MSSCHMDAIFHSEERYSKLSISYSTEEEHQQIETTLKHIAKDYTLKPSIYTTDISGGRKVLVIEFHDDYDREAGEIFEQMIKELDIKKCEE